MKKIILMVILSIVILITLLFVNKEKTFKGIATIIDTNNFSESIVEIKSNDKVIGTATIDSNIFNVGDKLEVEGSKKDNLVINKIKYLGTTEEEKISIINNCEENPMLYDYKSRVQIKTDEGLSFIRVHSLPIKLKNQEYDLNISPLEYFKIKYANTIYEYILISNYDILFTSEDKFTVEEATVNYEDKKENLEYKFEDNTITFASVEGAVYSVVIEYENGDIINYLFA